MNNDDSHPVEGFAVTYEPDGSVAITPDLVREVTDKVYALLLRDLKIERERGGHGSSGFTRFRNNFRSSGGRRC